MDTIHDDKKNALSPDFIKSRRMALTEVAMRVVLMLGGCVVMLGWLLHVPILFRFWEGGTPVVFNTGLGLALGGASMALMTSDRAWVKSLGWGAALVVGCIGSLTFFEFVTSVPLGIDHVTLHSWYDYGNTQHGRMAPNTAIALVLCSMSIALSQRVRGRASAIVLLSLIFSLFLVAVTGMVGNFLAPDLLFGWARSARMAMPTAIGMLSTAVALWMGWLGSSWHGRQLHLRFDETLRLVAAAILVVSTAASGLAGFVLMQKVVQSILEKNIDEEMQHRQSLILVQANQFQAATRAILTLSGARVAANAALEAKPAGRDKLLEDFEDKARLILGQGYQRVALLDEAGRVMAAVGAGAQIPSVESALGAQGTGWIWDEKKGFSLRSIESIRGGSIVVDEEASDMARALFDIKTVGKSGEVTMCVDLGVKYRCFPNPMHEAPFEVPMQTGKTVSPYPMAGAVAGRSGTTHTIDYKLRDVYASYRSLGPKTGLVVKQEVSEIYAVVRESLLVGIALLVGVGVLGAMLLYSQLSPLSRRMLESEAEAKERGDEVIAVIDAVADAIVTMGEDGKVDSFNPAARALFGWGRRVCTVCPCPS